MNVLHHSFNFFCNTKLCQIHFFKKISSSQLKFRDPVPGTPGQVTKNLIQFGPGKINRNYYWSLLSEGRDDLRHSWAKPSTVVSRFFSF